MKRMIVLLALAAFAVGVLSLPSADAGSCNGRGKTGQGTPPSACRKCEVPPGCTLVECNKCGCDVLCPEGMVRTYPVGVPIRPRQ